MRTPARLAALLLAFSPLLPLAACDGDLGGVGPGSGGGQDPKDPFPEDPFGDEGVCADVSVRVSGVTPTVSLLIDQSGSMDEAFGGRDRWSAVYDTLMSDGGLVQRLQSEVRFGLDLYTSYGGGASCPVLTTTAPSLDNFAAMNQVYAPARPAEDTPTGEALHAVAEVLGDFQEPGPKIIVLGTDGEPDTCAEPNPQNGQPQAIAAAQRAFEAGIRTFVVSVGDEVGAEHLQDMANAGVGLPVDGPEDAPYYVALDADELVAAFENIIGGVTGCVFTMDGEVDPSRAGDGMVALDGVILEPGTDWRLLDGKTFEILGAACETIKDGNEHDVAAVFPCGSVVIN